MSFHRTIKDVFAKAVYEGCPSIRGLFQGWQQSNDVAWDGRSWNRSGTGCIRHTAHNQGELH